MTTADYGISNSNQRGSKTCSIRKYELFNDEAKIPGRKAVCLKKQQLKKPKSYVS